MKERVSDFDCCPSVLLNECLKTPSHVFRHLLKVLMKLKLSVILGIYIYIYIGTMNQRVHWFIAGTNEPKSAQQAKQEA